MPFLWGIWTSLMLRHTLKNPFYKISDATKISRLCDLRMEICRGRTGDILPWANWLRDDDSEFSPFSFEDCLMKMTWTSYHNLNVKNQSHNFNIYVYNYNAYIIAYERRLLFKLIWKAAFVWVTPYLVQLTFSLEACSWKNGDLVFQRWSFFSILETCMGIDDPYVKKPCWRRNWNAM